MSSDAYDEPLTVMPIRGAVIVSAPKGGGIAAITPEAALASAQRLIDAARLATSGALPEDPCE
jgi:hypothetical protein